MVDGLEQDLGPKESAIKRPTGSSPEDDFRFVKQQRGPAGPDNSEAWLPPNDKLLFAGLKGKRILAATETDDKEKKPEKKNKKEEDDKDMVASSVAVIALVLKDKDRKGVDKQTVRHLQNACEFAYDRTGGDKGVKAAIQHLKDKLKGSEVKASLIKDGDLMKVDDKDLTEAQRAMKKQVVDYFADKYKKKPDYLYIAEIVKDGKSTLVPVFPYARITWPFDK